MKPPVSPVLFALVLFAGMLLMLELGRRYGVRCRPREAEGERSNLTTIEGAIFALFGLVMAFTFSGAASRFNEKRALIAEEANTIETAYLRLELLPESVRPELQELFRHYLDSRLATYRKLPDFEAAKVEMVQSKTLQEEIWTKAIAGTASRDAHVDAGKLLIPALNNMIDIMTTRTMALHNHPPNIIYVLLFGLGMICSLLAGYRMSAGLHRSWLHILCFTTITVIVIYVITDVEYPRAGLIHLETFDQVLIDVRSNMH